MPDDEITVMGYFPGQEEEVWPCWHDGDDGWRDASGAALEKAPTHWAHLHELTPNALRPLPIKAQPKPISRIPATVGQPAWLCQALNEGDGVYRP